MVRNALVKEGRRAIFAIIGSYITIEGSLHLQVISQARAIIPPGASSPRSLARKLQFLPRACIAP